MGSDQRKVGTGALVGDGNLFEIVEGAPNLPLRHACEGERGFLCRVIRVQLTGLAKILCSLACVAVLQVGFTGQRKQSSILINLAQHRLQ